MTASNTIRITPIAAPTPIPAFAPTERPSELSCADAVGEVLIAAPVFVELVVVVIDVLILFVSVGAPVIPSFVKVRVALLDV